ncbi:YjbH domain-containing protein [Emticicia agri]|uniref:Uncharacterized protein n=1 Tax=Emticicia agri TaxID=2492393 RepID=A0A4Q5LVP3_9BACT|nr:YjbH domain-containing protein [Emticicia agri]RYU93734.1 hypothetical protein EWM59_20665 [Emticicia agri]
MTKVKVDISITLKSVILLKKSPFTPSFSSVKLRRRDGVMYLQHKFSLYMKVVCSLCFIFIGSFSYSQINLSGKQGLLYIPDARFLNDGSFTFGYNYNPMKYSLGSPGKNAEQVLFANIVLSPRFDVTVSLLQLIATEQNKVSQGIGDRILDFRYLLLKEKKIQPSVAFVMSSPFTIHAFLLTHAVVGTKHIKFNPAINLGVTLGYGSPYFIYRNEDNTTNSNIFSSFKWQNKREYHGGRVLYLVGPFGGLNLKFKNIAGLMAEWDSQHLNVGAYITLWKSWTIQGGLLNKDKVMFGSSVQIPLLKSKKRIAKLDKNIY